MKISLDWLGDLVSWDDSSEDLAAKLTAAGLNVEGIEEYKLSFPGVVVAKVLKREQHRESLLRAATGGSGKFFLGTDSAPHPVSGKEKGCGCAGIYTAHAALELYATAFEEAGALDRLEGFASFFGPDFYGLPRNKGTVTLEKKGWEIPASYGFGVEEVVPLEAGKRLAWRFCESAD